MSRTLPPAAVIEIVERNRTTDDTPGGSVVVPDEIRINGTPLLVEQGSIKIHEMEIGSPKNVVSVTLTLFARRVTIAADGDLTSGPMTTAEHVQHGLGYIQDRYGKSSE